ncbi:uncharacterized protein LOC111692390 [Anoplophora glabripennis]|uniref:uncharacterized protein LOC111692390 n=1 Tax=Anoplophora glabripennis TaxID=217634 RepID=UPI000C771D42|nr:uncharacterized protein LOC111692390 [Anoplophora glabripennis]
MAASDILKYLCYQICALLGVLKKSYTEETAMEGLRQCTKAVRNIKDQLKTVKTVGEKQHLLTQLAQIKSFRCQFKSIKKMGLGHNPSRKQTSRDRVHWDDSANAFDSRIRTGVISNLKHKDPKEFLKDSFALFKRRIANALKKEEAVKVNSVFGGQFRLQKADRILEEPKYFTTKNSPIYRDTNLEAWFHENVVIPISTELDDFQERDSGWALSSITNLGININKFTPQMGSSYIDLPTSIKKKRACVNA